MPRQLLVIGNAIGHTIAGAGILYLLITHKIDPTVGAAILAGLGGFWSGVGTAVTSTGSSTAATEKVGASVAPDPVPTSVAQETHVSPILADPSAGTNK